MVDEEKVIHGLQDTVHMFLYRLRVSIVCREVNLSFKIVQNLGNLILEVNCQLRIDVCCNITDLST